MNQKITTGIYTKRFNHLNIKVASIFVWSFMTFASTISCLFWMLSNFNQDTNKGALGIYAPNPPSQASIDLQASYTNAQELRLQKIFSNFNCPLLGTEKFMVEKAKEFNIPYWLVAAVAFQESNCGKKSPKVNGAESYNAWGYGVWGNNIKTFSSWEAGITAVSKYFANNFYSKGITDLCEIMKTYTPPSNGSWCEGVKYFAQIIESY